MLGRFYSAGVSQVLVRCNLQWWDLVKKYVCWLKVEPFSFNSVFSIYKDILFDCFVKGLKIIINNKEYN